MIVNEMDRERLVELFTERYQALHADRPVQVAYVDGRIDEFCEQNAIDDMDRALLAVAVAAGPVGRSSDGPGVRLVDGEPRYSAAWLDAGGHA